MSEALRAGSLSLIYEGGALRRIRWGNVEIVRAIYAAVRDADWLVVPGETGEERLERAPDGFRLESERRHDREGVVLAARAVVAGGADGLTFDWMSVAGAAFRRNRIGLCVLHPVRECAGRPCTVVGVDGTEHESVFPDLISPHQPFTDVRAIRWRPAPLLEAEVEMTGETFETEDQRNWADASFKTYGTPLALPFPAPVAPGETIRQRVVLRVRPVPGHPRLAPRMRPEDPIPFGPTDAPTRPLPPLGLSRAPDGETLSEEHWRFLHTLGLSHLRAELRLGESGWPGEWAEARRQAARLGIPLELAVFFGPDPDREAEALREALQERPARIRSILLLSRGRKVTPVSLWEAAAPWLRAAYSGSLLGVGTDAFFAEVNRDRAALPDADFLCFSANPQVHAEDDRTILENLSALADVVRSARALRPGRAVHVSPVTLRRRNNPDATGDTPAPIPPDPRQSSLFGAAWALGSAKYLAEAGTDSVTFGDVAGPGGVLDGSATFPMAFLLREIWGGGPCEVRPSLSGDAGRVEGLILQGAGGDKFLLKFLLANLTPDAQRVRPAWESAPARLHVMDGAGGFRPVPASGDVSLPPYALAVLEPGVRP